MKKLISTLFAVLLVFSMLPIAVNAVENIIAYTPLTATEGELYVGNPILANTGVGPLSFQLIEGPQGMTIESNTGILKWTPTENQIGQNTFKVTVTDHGDNDITTP